MSTEAIQDAWTEHPVHTRADWTNEVANLDTQLGYWEWVAHKTEERCPRCESSEIADLTPPGDRSAPARQCDNCHSHF